MARPDLTTRIAASLLAMTFAHAALAQPAPAKADTREREALRRAQQAAAKAQEERNAMQRERDEALGRLNAAIAAGEQSRRDASRVRATAGSADAAAKSLRVQLDAAVAKLADTERLVSAGAEERRALADRIAALDAALRASEARSLEIAAQAEAERENSKRTVTALGRDAEQREAANAACRKDNGELVAVADELMQRYERKGVWEALRQSEPLLQLKSVETQNLLQRYRDRVEAARTRAGSGTQRP